jgi:Zn-dependent membrane protease YugP
MLLYFLFALPAFLLGMYAQWRVKSSFSKYSQVRTMRNVTGAQVARTLLDAQGLYDVRVEKSDGFLSDHYDPRGKVLRLSPDVHDLPSVAAAGVAAHEMGHAMQDANNYWGLVARGAMVPAVQFGSWLGPLVFFAGFLFLGDTVAWIGLILFAAVAAFALVTLPVEFDASARAKRLLVSNGILFEDEMQGVNRVLNAAALTYVAAAIQALMTLLYYAFLLLGRRD